MTDETGVAFIAVAEDDGVAELTADFASISNRRVNDAVAEDLCVAPDRGVKNAIYVAASDLRRAISASSK